MESGRKKDSITLVIGGSRSGKSAFAEKLVLSRGGRHFYLATAPCCDEEMAKRIQAHRDRRAKDGWVTIEEQVELPAALQKAADDGADDVLVECLTLWINNLLYHDPQMTEGQFRLRCQGLLSALRHAPFRTTLVLSEAGMGMVPENVLARRFRDFSGLCSQLIATEADEVFWLIAGLPQKIKG